MRRLVVASVVLVGLLIGVLFLRASRFVSQQVPVEPATVVPVDASAAAQRLAGALRIATVSPEEPSERSAEAFSALHSYLGRSFPKVNAALRREVIGRAALLYTWPGTDSVLQPIVLCGHLDVVPVEPGTETAWTHPPFGG